MRKFHLIIFGLMLNVSFAFAQLPQQTYKNTVRAGVSWLALPDAVGGLLYQAQYARHLFNDRFVLTTSAGYMNISNPRSLVGSGITQYGRPTKRITFDLTAAYDFLPSKRHALRFGIVPSVWYREDDDIASGQYLIYPDGRVEIVTTNWKREQGWEIGGFGQFEYECYLSRRTTAGLRLAFGGLTGHDGITPILGATVGYRL